MSFQRWHPETAPLPIVIPNNAGDLPVDGNSAAACAQRLEAPEDRRLVLWLTRLSHRDNGFRKLTETILESFPHCAVGLVEVVEDDRRRYARGDTTEKVRADLPRLLHRLCVQPELLNNDYERRTISSDFKDLPGALAEIRERESRGALDSIAETALARRIWTELDFALENNRIVLLIGESRIGKTTAARAWAEAHAGEARFVSLSGIVNRGSFWRELARALEVMVPPNCWPNLLQSRVEDILYRARPMLVVDEAHFLFAQDARHKTRPQFLDWLDTAVFNHGVPCALVATPQIRERLSAAQTGAGWNSDQFLGRSKWVDLKPTLASADLLKVARKLAPEAAADALEVACAFAADRARTLPGVPALVEALESARFECQRRRGKTMALADLDCAIRGHCLPSEGSKKLVSLIKVRTPGLRRVTATPPAAAGAAIADPARTPCDGAARRIDLPASGAGRTNNRRTELALAGAEA